MKKSNFRQSALTIIGRDCSVDGDVANAEAVHIEGNVTGNILGADRVVVGASGRVEGSLAAGTIVVFGTVEGDIEARNTVEIKKTGRVNGRINTQILAIESGGVCTSLVAMGSVRQKPQAAVLTEEN